MIVILRHVKWSVEKLDRDKILVFNTAYLFTIYLFSTF